MNLLKLSLILIIIMCTSCSLEYRRAPDTDGWNGFYDEEIKPGVYVLEIQKIGGFSYVNTLNQKLMEYYNRRALELCPNGYTKEVKVIKPHQAYFDTFRCPLVFCQDYPMLTGIVSCNEII